MKERPILFSGEMVKAVLDGRKTQTRRVIKFDPDKMKVEGGQIWTLRRGEWWPWTSTTYSPYGQPGDWLWVRETWQIHRLKGPTGLEFPNILYRADSSTQLLIDKRVWQYVREKATWRPSIHMPRWASRITSEILSLRVERVQDISEEDIRAEGLRFFSGGWLNHADDICYTNPILAFHRLWDSIYAKRGYGWNVNPWVWVIEFKKLETT